MTRRFAYHRAIAPMMWVFVALAGVELVVAHFLIALWRGDVAVALSLVTLAIMAWLVSAILSFRRLPVLIDDDRLTMRVGTIKSIAIKRSVIAGVRTEWPSGAHKEPGTVNLALIAHPNVIVDLDPPLKVGRKAITSVAHRFDDPAAFVAAVQGVGRRE